jgi:DNA-binding NarL/FixJ family response regulator
MIRVLLISDIRLYREGLAEMLARDGRLEVVGAEAGPAEAMDRLDQLGSVAVVLDVAIPEALTSVRTMAARCPAARVVALGVSGSRSDVIACAEAGAVGYVCRESSLDELVTVVEAATRGELHCSAEVAAGLMQRVAWLARRLVADQEAHLTPRQMDIAELLNRGLTNQEISTRLHIDVSTVKTHVHHIFGKLGAHRRAEAIVKLRGRDLLLAQGPPVRSPAS